MFKKFIAVVAVVIAVVACNINSSKAALSLDAKIAKVETAYEVRVQKIDAAKRGTAEKKAMLKKHARQNADLKIAQLKELDTLKTVKKVKKTK